MCLIMYIMEEMVFVSKPASDVELVDKKVEEVFNGFFKRFISHELLFIWEKFNPACNILYRAV